MTKLSREQLSELKDCYLVMRENVSDGLRRRQGKSTKPGKIYFTDNKPNRKGTNNGIWVWCRLALDHALNSGLYNEYKRRPYNEGEIRAMFSKDNIKQFYLDGKNPEEVFWLVFRQLSN